jgi:uncharacterized protein
MRGRYWELDDEGFIRNDSSPNSVAPEWSGLIAAAVAACRAGLVQDMDGCYLTGSVSRGLAVPGVSDLDVIAVTAEGSADADEAWVEEAEVVLQRSFPIAASVGLEVWPIDWLSGETPETWIFPFILKTHSVPLAGNDRAKSIRRYRVEAEIARDDVMQIETDINEAVEELERTDDPVRVTYWSRRISKNVLRAAFGLVMHDVHRYTRDADLCRAAFVERYPECGEDMATLERIVKGEPVTRADMLALLGRIERWIFPLADQWLDEHGFTKVLR